MGNVSFPDRFELLDVIREGEVQTLRARERATGRIVEAHFASSANLLSGMQAIDQGSHEGKFYAVTALAAQPAPLDTAGAWRIKPQDAAAQPVPGSELGSALGSEPGDFTRMFQLRQAPEPVAAPVSKPVPVGAAASQPGQFTRAFQRPAVAPSAAPVADAVPGQPGEFTRMFQQPAAPVPETHVQASQPRGAWLVIAIAVFLAIAVFILMRTLY